MKVEIDLNDILFDENYGPENLNDSIRRQVINAIKREIQDEAKLKISEQVNRTIQEEVLTQVKLVAKDILPDLIDREYQPVNSWGAHDGKPTTMRNQFIESLKKEFVYKKGQYSSDKNEFTKSIDSLVDTMMQEFKKEYNKIVDANFTQEALNYATLKMKERLGIK